MELKLLIMKFFSNFNVTCQIELRNLNNQQIMEYLAAQKVKDAWGKNPCDHPNLEKEYYVGAFLINFVCTQCGQEFTLAQKFEIDEAQKRTGRDLS